MTEDTWARVETYFAEFPIARAEPVSAEEIDLASERLGIPFPEEYREFLLRTGGAIMGSYPILGLRQADVMGEGAWNIIEVNERYRAEGWPGVERWLIVSIDLAGNPVGIAEDGHVWVYDHDFRQAVQIAEDFEDFIRREGLKVSA